MFHVKHNWDAVIPGVPRETNWVWLIYSVFNGLVVRGPLIVHTNVGKAVDKFMAVSYTHLTLPTKRIV